MNCVLHDVLFLRIWKSHKKMAEFQPIDAKDLKRLHTLKETPKTVSSAEYLFFWEQATFIMPIACMKCP
jgi:hypothetical protein